MLYDRLGQQMRACSRHASNTLHSLTVLHSILVLAFREGPSSLVVQFFESPDFTETDIVTPIVRRFCC